MFSPYSFQYCNDYNKNDQPFSVYLGDDVSNLKTDYEYDNFNRISYIRTGNNYEMDYNRNDITGNLESRTDMIQNLTECFAYNYLDRLRTSQLTAMKVRCTTP